MLRHRIPVEDSKPHYESLTCPCNPELYEGDRYDVCMHHAFDGREIILAVELLLKIRCEDCGYYLGWGGEHRLPPPPMDEARKSG